MPYELVRDGSGYKVATKDTGKTHSDKPLNRQRALAQMSALDADTADIPHRARGGKVNLSGKQKKKAPPKAALAAAASALMPGAAPAGGLPPEPNGTPPVMALPQGKPAMKSGGKVRFKTKK